MLDILRKRRSIRKYRGEKIGAPLLDLLKEALLRCPTARNAQPWEFIFVDDPGILEKLAHTKTMGSSFLADAPLAVVVCGDETRSDIWVEDCAIAAITLHYTAHSLNLGSCWIHIRNRPHDQEKSAEAYVQELLRLPAHIRVLAMMAIGYPAEEKTGHPEKSLLYERIHENRFG